MKHLFLTWMALCACMAGMARTYTKVTSEPASWAGEYLIVYETGNVAMNGKEVADAVNNTVAVTIADGSITMTDDSYAFTITAKAGGYSIQGNKYIGTTSDANSLGINAADNYTNSIDWNGGDVLISCNGAVLRYNANSGQTRFRYYKSSSYSAQKGIALYKKAGGVENPAASVALNKTTAALHEGEKVTLVATVTGTNSAAPCTDVVAWSSNATSVATVDQSGVVCAVGTGSATITATAGSVSATCVVTVSAAQTIVLTFPADEQQSVQTYTTEWTATMSGHTWTFDGWNNNRNGWNYIKAQARTTANTIVSDVISQEIGKVAVTIDQVSANVTLTLEDNDSETPGVYPFTIDGPGVYTVETGHKTGMAYTLKVMVPTNPTGKSIQISRIEYCIGNNDPSTPTAVTGVTLNMTSKELEVEATQQLTATVAPSTAVDKSVTWSSNNTGVATVSESGLVTAVAVGSAVITVTTTDGGYTATCAITVKAKTTPDPGPGPGPEPEDPEGTAYTGIFTSKAWANAAGVWVKTGNDGAQYTSNQGVQMTATIGTATLESADEYTVNGVRINYCTNKSSGAGSFQVQVGTGEAKSVSTESGYQAFGTGGDGTKLRNATILFDPAETGKVTVTISCSANSVYVNSITIFGTKKDVETGINANADVNAEKVLRNGKILILRNGQCYDLRGNRVE